MTDAVIYQRLLDTAAFYGVYGAPARGDVLHVLTLTYALLNLAVPENGLATAVQEFAAAYDAKTFPAADPPGPL